MIGWLGLAACLLAALPAAMVIVNLRMLRAPLGGHCPEDARVSILIPARNEAARIGSALEAAMATRGVAFEIIVLDDGSSDGTNEVVLAAAAAEPRLRLVRGPPLPAGWTGKAHACQRLAEAAGGSHLLFVDADVRLAPDAARSLVAYASARGLVLVSAVPRQIMESLGELLTVPLINFLILGYLPIAMMRKSDRASLGTGCGQLVMVEREAYLAAGGHGLVRDCLHDGLMLPRRLREQGLRTDLVGGAGLASCRMYHGLAEAWAGFAKNAREGMATVVALPVWTVLLGGGHVLPFLLLPAGLLSGGVPVSVGLAILLSLGARLAVTLHGRENVWTVPLHPATVAVGLALQWTALVRAWRGRSEGWKGRAYYEPDSLRGDRGA